MSLAKLALGNSRITIIMILLIVVTGVGTYLTYPRAEDPTITIRNVSITAAYPGMTANRVEELITKPLEAAMREIAEIDEIKSTSRLGAVKLSIAIHDRIDILEPIIQKIRNKANDVKTALPEGTLGPVVNDEEGLTAVATVALWADGFSMAEMRDIARDTRDRFYTLSGVRKVQILGVQDERIYLEMAPTRLAQLGVSPTEIFGALAQQNIIEPGGEIIADGRSILLEPSGIIGSVDEIRAVVFRIPGTDRVLRLDEVLTIRRQLVDPPHLPSFYNDRPAIILSVSTVAGTNNVEFGDRLTALINIIQQELPIGYVLEYATYQPGLIAAAVDSAVSNVYQTLAIIFVVVMAFLGIRTGLIVGFFVPLTMLLGVIVMSLLGIELQRMSIAATIIALGLLVDNGIVVAEDIRARLEHGAERRQAAIDAGRSLARPLLTSSLTTTFAFLPMLLIEGNSGDYVRSLAQVVVILLLGSWFLSMTVMPALCVWFLKLPPSVSGSSNPVYDGRMYRFYRTILGIILKWRLVAICGLFVLLLLSIQLLGTVKTEFFPLGDRNQFLVYLDFEAGTDIRETQSELRKMTEWLADTQANPEITNHIAYVGYGGPRFFLSLSPVDPAPHKAFVLVNLRSVEDVGPVIERVNAFLDARLPGAQADAKKMWFGGTEPGVVEIRLIGPDGDILAERGERLISAFHDIEGTLGIKQDWENKILKLVVDVDQTRARRAGVTSIDVASALNTTYSGTTISDYKEGDKTIPIVLRGDDSMRFSLSGLQRVQVFSRSLDKFVALEQVANVKSEWQFSRIQRRNQLRTLTVEARNQDLPAPMLLAAMASALEELDLPAGYRYEIGGEIEKQEQANKNLADKLPFALAGIIIMLVGQFNSFRKCFIVLATIPLILIGGTLGLVIMQANYSFMVLLGFFSLAGILIINGIILIDRIQAEEQAGREPLEAVIAACLSRLRPILMTTLTTVLGLVPLIVFGGALFYGMASVIAYGLIVATLITLGFVPALYTLLFRISTAEAASAKNNPPNHP